MEWLKFILTGGVGSAIVVGLFALIQWLLTRKAQKEDKAADRETADVAARYREIASLREMVESLIVADRTILYDRIKHLAKSYIKSGYITVEEYEDLKRMHAVYHNTLSGNGFLDSIMEDVDKLEKRVL